MSQALTPESVLIEFLRNLGEFVQASEPVVFVLRGSLLLRHWFGEKARPPGDIDLECFERIRGTRGDRFPSLVDHARGLCCYAIEDGPHRPVEFLETDVPADGQSLWEYGTPGQRFYAGWTWHGQEVQSGRLQIDIAQSGAYELRDISVADVAFTSVHGVVFSFPAYTPEMMLAAKVSWLLRSLNRKSGDIPSDAPRWKGDPKDIFDTHLLLTEADLDAGNFRKSLMAVGAEDRLEWNNIEAIFDVRQGNLSDDDFANWPEFSQRHPGLVKRSPVEMLEEIADRVEPLLGDFYLREEMTFLRAINADPVDEFSYLIYADWLEERGDPRARFLRLFTQFYFHHDDRGIFTRFLARLAFRPDQPPPPAESARVLAELRTAWPHTSVPWLLQLFGTSARLSEIRQRIEG